MFSCSDRLQIVPIDDRPAKNTRIVSMSKLNENNIQFRSTLRLKHTCTCFIHILNLVWGSTYLRSEKYDIGLGFGYVEADVSRIRTRFRYR